MEPAADNTPRLSTNPKRKDAVHEEPKREGERNPEMEGSPDIASGSAVTHKGMEHETDAVSEVDAAVSGAETSDGTPVGEGIGLETDSPDPPAEKKKKKAKKKSKKGKAKGSKQASPDKGKADAKKDAAPKFGTSRGIETMFRSNYRVHMDLSAIADTKANIMISINGLILPILLGAISPKIDSNPWLLIPTSFLMVGCLISMIFAIRSARPRVSKEPVSLDQISRGGYNILFFGHFANMTRDDYEEGMAQMMTSNEDIYRNMIRDLHGLGSVLNAKYALLRTSYTVFMIAISTGVLLFIATFCLIALGVISVPEETLLVPYDSIPTP
ncbi:MAG: Pycsar system effector family protein [Bacteroidota bacterium]